MKINNIDKIYVCHHDVLTERKKFLVNHLSENGFDDYVWVQTHKPNTIDINKLSETYPFITKNIPFYNRSVSISELSLILKHYDIWREFEIDDKINSILILEDDVIFTDNAIEILNEHITSELIYDFISIGTCCNLYADGKGLVRTNRGSRCTHAYIISRGCYNKIKGSMSYIQEPIDFFINKMVTRYDLVNYWLEPPVAYQNKSFETSIIR